MAGVTECRVLEGQPGVCPFATSYEGGKDKPFK